MVEWKKLDTLLDFEHHSSVKKGRKFSSFCLAVCILCVIFAFRNNQHYKQKVKGIHHECNIIDHCFSSNGRLCYSVLSDVLSLPETIEARTHAGSEERAAEDGIHRQHQPRTSLTVERHYGLQQSHP